jgi:hypothetical protein
MIDYMLRLSGADFGLASVVAVGDFVRHYGTKQTGFVTKVMPQYDGTAELLVRPFPVRYDSLSYHRSHSAGWEKPCPTCTDEQLCEGGLAAKARDEADKQWATYHVNSCQSPATLMGDAQTHRCHRCDHPEDFTDKMPCTRVADLMDLYARSMAIITAVNEADEGTSP